MEKIQNSTFDQVGLVKFKSAPPKEMTPPKMHINRHSLEVILTQHNSQSSEICKGNSTHTKEKEGIFCFGIVDFSVMFWVALTWAI